MFDRPQVVLDTLP